MPPTERGPKYEKLPYSPKIKLLFVKIVIFVQTKHLYNKKKFKEALFSQKAVTKSKCRLKKITLTQISAHHHISDLFKCKNRMETQETILDI